MQRVNKLYIEKPVRITQQEHLLILNSETTQNLNIYLHNYQTETAIFLATKHEKQLNYGMQLFKFFHTENTWKQQKNGVFWEELLSENDFEAVLINFCCYQYIIVSMLQRQFRSEDWHKQGHCWSYANSLNTYFHSYTQEKTYLAVYYVLIGDTSQVSVFFLPNKNE